MERRKVTKHMILTKINETGVTLTDDQIKGIVDKLCSNETDFIGWDDVNSAIITCVCEKKRFANCKTNKDLAKYFTA